MNETQQRSPEREQLHRWSRPVRYRSFLMGAGMLTGAFFLASTQLGGQPLPLAACLVGALPLGSPSVIAACGAVIGYLLAFGAAESAEFIALSILLLAALAVFQGTSPAADRRFLPYLAAGVCAILGSVRLLDGMGDVWLWAVHSALAGLGTAVFRKALHGALREESPFGAAGALENAAEVLELLCDQLPEQAIPPSAAEAESVYDGAAERVCRCCARFHRCWQHRADETYTALTGAARQIIEHGVAAAEDFPQSFRENCCHIEGFVTAINQELEGMLFRRRYRMEVRESRQLLAEEFACVAQYLRAEGARTQQPSAEAPAYLPEVGACRIGKGGSRVCGDRGACFRGMHTDFFVLLCDGMGTGEEAARLSKETVHLLERLLKSGLSPESALKILNGAEVLRGSERFTTIDLLHIDLTNAECCLHKWGAAPSYLRDGDGVKKIGTSTPPPGVGVGGGNTPERYQMSLKRGEMLVLASDGAEEVQTEAAIAAYSGESARELAALLISGQPTEDDMSAVVVCLKPCVS